MRWPAFVGPSYLSESWRFDQERTVNWYVAPSETEGTTSKTALFPTPGVTTIGTVAGGNAGRAHLFAYNREFAVIGNFLYEITEAGIFVSRGGIVSGSGGFKPTTISSNGDGTGTGGGELFVTAGGRGYIYDVLAETLTYIPALQQFVTQGASIDGFFLALDAATGSMYVSDLRDGTSWDLTQVAQSQTDPWIAMKVSDPYIYLFGTSTTQVWYNAGTAPFPFALHPSGSLRYGIAGDSLAAVANGELVWVGRSEIGEGMVLRASGFSPERVSTYPIQRILQDYASLENGVADVYEDGGHVFVLFSIPGAETTWTLDLSTGYWSERGTWISEDAEWSLWRPRYHALAFGQHRWLDSETGNLYRSSIDIHTDVNDRELRRMRRAPAIQYENQRIFYGAFEVLLDSGVGNTVTPGENPQVMLRYSNDGGKTWGPELWRAAGAVGEYSRRVRWERGGMGTQRVVEVSVSDPVPWRLVDAFLDVVQPPRGVSSAQMSGMMA
jgi:hypothetical protein